MRYTKSNWSQKIPALVSEGEWGAGDSAGGARACRNILPPPAAYEGHGETQGEECRVHELVEKEPDLVRQGSNPGEPSGRTDVL